MRTLLNLLLPIITALFIGIGTPSTTYASEQNTHSTTTETVSLVDQFETTLNDIMKPITTRVAGLVFYEVWFGNLGPDQKCSAQESCFGIRWIVVWLASGALFFTFYLKFINIRGFKHALDLVRGKYSDPSAPGEISHFQALATALSGTVGLGNIAGVAIAISIGGPGATFWMIIAGLLGMSSKFAECTLGVLYRNEFADGRVSGGPMHYLSKGLAERNLSWIGQFLAVFFSICCIGGAIGAGNMFQANQAFSMIASVAGEDSVIANMPSLFGVVLAVLVGIVIIGGIQSIAKVTSKLVPIMAAIYLFSALFILAANASDIPVALGLICKGAFNGNGVIGGTIGSLIAGLQRAAFSNEAGIGSASIAHSAVKTREPVTEGFVALLEPFVDTVVICTITALVIILSGVYTDQTGMSGVALTAEAFSSTIPWFDWVLMVAVVLFAYSTLLSWSYYATKCWTFLVGESPKKQLGFRIVYCFFVIVGSVMSLEHVIGFSDAMIFLMGLANMTGLYLLAPVVKSQVNHYWNRLKKGELKKFK